ncbi:hypothetical protein NP233_g10603 [Leucocoprinus birnbaumii]|uniref:UBA domain-containing protein n=1 Tax=Leucocoprinus birnbaumii TaxID=56174 RepID=A0AAD5YPP5_9AGAR|nr:hypothetical protein NP233_g10603 [Leucocoprinus birnbaumii]
MSFLPPIKPGRVGTGGSNPQDNMNNITEMIRTDPSMRQMFIDIAAQQDPALGQQLTQSLQLLDIATQTAGSQGAHGQSDAALSREEQEAIQRASLTNLGYTKKQALVAYLASNKNEEHATSYLATKAPAIGELFNSNPSLRRGLNEFIAQSDPTLARQARDNPALLKAALQHATVGGGGGTVDEGMTTDRRLTTLGLNDPDAYKHLENMRNIAEIIRTNPSMRQMFIDIATPRDPALGWQLTGSNSLPFDCERRVSETLPLSPRTSRNTNSPSFHIIKLPALAGHISHLLNLVVEFCIQPLGAVKHQAIWWTSYVIISRRGILTRGSGVYAEWNEVGKVLSHPATGIIAPRTNGIQIADISKGVLNGNQTNGTVLRVVDLKDIERNAEIFAVLVASGMHDGAYQAHGQATLEYRILSS